MRTEGDSPYGGRGPSRTIAQDMRDLAARRAGKDERAIQPEDLLRVAREFYGSKAEIARRIGRSWLTVVRWYRGQRPDAASLLRLHALLAAEHEQEGNGTDAPIEDLLRWHLRSGKAAEIAHLL